MAIAFTYLSTWAINVGTDATSYTSGTGTPPTDGYLIWATGTRRAAGADTPTITAFGLTWTQAGTTIANATGLANSSISVFVAPAAGATAGTILTDYGANTQLGFCGSLTHVTGVDLSGTVVQAVSANDGGVAGTTGTVTLAAAGNSNNRPYAVFNHLFNEPSTERANWTELSDQAGGGHARSMIAEYRGDAFETTCTATWANSTGWSGIAIEFKAAGAGLFEQAVGGTLTSSGTAVKQTSKTLAGTLTTAGAAIKKTAKSLAGSLTSSGALAAAHTYMQAVGGTLTTAGTLVKNTGKVLAGTLSTAGAVLKATAKFLAGDLTSSGVVTTLRSFGVAVGGTLTTAGTLTKNTGKVLGGTLSTAGALVKNTGKSLAGTLTTAGAIVKGTGKNLAGTLTTAGTVKKLTAKVLAGTLTMSGVLTKLTKKALAGALSFIGTLSAIIFFEDLVSVTVSDAAVTSATLSNAAVTTATLIDAAVTVGTLANTVVTTITMSNAAVTTATISDVART